MNTPSTPIAAPSARLFTTPGCPHCAAVKHALQQLLQEGVVAGLEVVDISQQPELAAELNIRSVPWLEMGGLIFTGAQPLAELRGWAVRLTGPEALVDFYEKLLAAGELAVAEAMLQKSPDTLASLVTLLVRDALPLQVRIGTVALFEGFSGTPQLQRLLPELEARLAHRDHRVRADIAYLLGLSGRRRALAPLQSLLQDENSEVREIAAEAIDELEAG